MKLTVGDLFCGAGGFSEGFRQAGFDILWAIDCWEPALKTYEKNIPCKNIFLENLLEFDASQLEPVDVIIGSPPCQSFSLANRGGSGDIESGMKLVHCFFEIVNELKPQYWVMENVPNHLEQLLKPNDDEPGESYRFSNGEIEIPEVERLNSADFGTPQKRIRLFTGSYPKPTRTHIEAQKTAGEKLSTNGESNLQEWIPMKPILKNLGSPLVRSNKTTGKLITDPLYDLKIPQSRLTLHQMDLTLRDWEIESSRRAKENHSWYGRMIFPDNIDKPSRTITATSASSSRGTIVIPYTKNGSVHYRQPSVRECASLMGFPITYQFWGGSLSQDIRLVGNAVTPPVSYAIAKTILQKKKKNLKKSTFDLDFELSTPYDVRKYNRPLEKRFNIFRRFRHHIPGTKNHHCRVDLDNHFGIPSSHPFYEKKHLKKWSAVLYLGYAKKHQAFLVDIPLAIRIMKQIISLHPKLVELNLPITHFIKDVFKAFEGAIPDATSLQAIWAGKLEIDAVGPHEIVDKIGLLVKEHFDREVWRGMVINPNIFARKLTTKKRISEGSDLDDSLSGSIDSYSAGALLATAIVADIANKSSIWITANHNQFYKVTKWNEKSKRSSPKTFLIHEREIAESFR